MTGVTVIIPFGPSIAVDRALPKHGADVHGRTPICTHNRENPEDDMTKTMASASPVFCLALLLPLAAGAAEPDAARFDLQRSGDHFVRLDRQTGAMSICEDKQGNLVCRMAADERTAYDDELDRLSDRVTALEKTVASNNGKSTLPTDADVDRSIGIMERMMRSFMGMAKEFRDQDGNDKALPQKTRALYE
jgi:hypothetical protein